MRSGVALALAGVLIAVGLAGCATPAAVTSTPPAAAGRGLVSLAQVGVEPKAIDVMKHEMTTIRYALSQPAAVRLDVVNEAGVVVRQFDMGREEAGLHTVRWDGRAGDEQFVPAGVYRYVIQAADVTYDPAEAGGEELQPWDFTYDRDTGTFRWVMPKAGWARLRIGIQGFPHLRTLLDWAPLEAGEQTIIWDGLDASGLIKAKDHPNLAVNLSVFAMPPNTVIVRNDQRSADRPPHTMDSTPSALLARPDAAYLHARHPRAICREPRLHVEFPGAGRLDPEGRPVLSGIVPLRVTLEPRDAEPVINSRFEVALFEDTTFLAEEEEGTTPFTYLWDTSRLAPGEHLLTANVLSYDDHYGVETIRVMVEPPQ